MNTNFEAILSEQRQSWNRVVRYVILILAIVVGCWYYVGLFDGERLGEGVPSLVSLIGEMFPPNFSEWRAWVKPVLDTLAMSIAGTAIA
ncbi:phosphonate ABC transporter, permease protein PhnE, partial [Acinetobacter sp. FDAARGOS_131]